MRKLLFFSILFSVFLLNTAVTCCDEDLRPDVSVAKNPESIINVLQQGTWKVTYFFDAKTNKSSTFSGYDFTFGSNEILLANNTSLDYDGKWSVIKSGEIGDNLNDINFTILFSSPNSFAELSDDWNIVQISETQIRLKGVDNDNGESNYLIFEKN